MPVCNKAMTQRPYLQWDGQAELVLAVDKILRWCEGHPSLPFTNRARRNADLKYTVRNRG